MVEKPCSHRGMAGGDVVMEGQQAKATDGRAASEQRSV